MANYNSSYTGAQIDSAVGRANSTDVTAGTVAASKAVVVDSNKDVTGFRNITGTGTATFANFVGTGDIDIGDASGDTVTITASVDSNIVPSADDTYDLGGSSAQWKDLYVDGTAYIDAIDFNGTAITSTGAELNLIDGGTARGTTAVATGDGILINDAGTMRMTNVDTVSTYFASHNVGGGNIVTTGALDSGSITSGFGNIDIGSSTFDTTGAVATGALTVGGTIDFNSGTIDLSTQTVDVTLNGAVDALNFDSNTLSIDASNNRVGIGTASPSQLLHLKATDNKSIILIEDSETNVAVDDITGGIWFQNDDSYGGTPPHISATIEAVASDIYGRSDLVFGVSYVDVYPNKPTERMRIVSATGNVGIGTAAPDGLLHVHKATAGSVDANASADELVVEGDGNTGINILSPDNYDANLYFGTETDNLGGMVKWDYDANLFTIGTHKSGGILQLQSDNGTEQMRIDSSGNVGIGDTDPSEAKLSITGVASGDYGLKIDQDQDSGSLYIDSQSTSASVIHIDTPVVTTGSVMNLDGANSLTTGSIIKATSNSATTDTRSLISIVNDNTAATGTTALKIQQDSTGASIDAGGYIVNEQGRQDHVANTMPAPYYRFDGVDDYVDLGASPRALVGSSSPFSVSAWINMDDDTNEYICGAMESSAERFYLRVVDASGTGYLRWGYGDTASTDTDGVISLNEWHHVVWTYDTTNAKIYIDGVLKNTTAVSGKTITNTDNLYIGVLNMDGAASNYLNGSIASGGIYNTALSATEVKELYSGASVPFKYKGANQTAQGGNVSDDMTSDATGNWSKTTSVLAFDAGNNWYDLDMNEGGTNAIITQAASGLTIGKRYRASCVFAKEVDSNHVGVQLINTTTSDVGAALTSTTSDQTCFVDFTASSATDSIRLKISTPTHSEIFNIKGIEVLQIGAVAEYDGSGVGASRWDDKSGNELHGTVTGATVENAPADADSGLTYEEGTWTAGLSSAGGGSITVNEGSSKTTYTKVGRMVSVQAYILVTSVITPTGRVTITGFPFTIGSNMGAATTSVYNNGISGDPGGWLQLRMGSGNSAYLDIQEGDGTNPALDLGNHFQASVELTFAVTYFI